MPSLADFYPWRYSEVRQTSGEEYKHQFVSVDNDSLTFGMGPHACPGRFFASNEIKVVVTELLKRYDIALGPEGHGDGENGFKRPKSLEHDRFIVPDPNSKVYLRNRKVGGE
jgi:cytochrome P450